MQGFALLSEFLKTFFQGLGAPSGNYSWDFIIVLDDCGTGYSGRIAAQLLPYFLFRNQCFVRSK